MEIHIYRDKYRALYFPAILRPLSVPVMVPDCTSLVCHTFIFNSIKMLIFYYLNKLTSVLDLLSYILRSAK